jgi:signal transduction histidine kinase
MTGAVQHEGEALARQREAIERSGKLAEMGRLAAGVAHELRNPLLVIDGRLQLLEAQIADGQIVATPALVNHLAKMGEASQRMKRIVQGLSSYSRPAGAEPTTLEVAEVLHEIAELVAYQARTGSIVVKVEPMHGLAPVRADRAALVQILLNLAVNGAEAMAESGGTLALRARTEGRDVIIEVADGGPGIPPGLLERIWEPFYTTKPEGTGLGLPIVAALVARVPGATITVESREGAGTTFRLALPAWRPAPA